MGIKRERLERRRSTAGGIEKMKDAGGVQQKMDDAGDAKREWRDRRGEAGVAEGCITKETTGAHGVDFPIQSHSSPEQLPPSGSGKTPPSSRAGRQQVLGSGTGAPTASPLPSSTLVAVPSPPLPGPGSPGMSPQKPQHSGVPSGCLAAPEQPGLQGA